MGIEIAKKGKLSVSKILAKILAVHIRTSLSHRKPALFLCWLPNGLILVQSLDKCQLKDVVAAKPLKLDAVVDDNGENWSMGQRPLYFQIYSICSGFGK